jgi:hypothetical protein
MIGAQSETGCLLPYRCCPTESYLDLPKEATRQFDHLGRDFTDSPRTERWLVMERLEYCVLQIVVSHLNVKRLARCVFKSKVASDSLKQRR